MIAAAFFGRLCFFFLFPSRVSEDDGMNFGVELKVSKRRWSDDLLGGWGGYRGRVFWRELKRFSQCGR